MKFKNCFTYFAFLALLTSFAFAEKPKRNVVFILSDDHRFDFMGFTGKLPWLKTPHMDNMAERGVYFDQAYVTTSLCSPSRASILTGLYAHTHTIVDNQAPKPGQPDLFPRISAASWLSDCVFWESGTWVTSLTTRSLASIIGNLLKDRASTLG
jgi:hypothetical protein